MLIRVLSEAFVDDLRFGLLRPFLDRVKKDNTLLLCIRNGYINIYYRGGNILKIEEKTNGSYEVFFDADYDKELTVQLPGNLVSDESSVEQWLKKLSELKQTMDFYLTNKEKLESINTEEEVETALYLKKIEDLKKKQSYVNSSTSNAQKQLALDSLYSEVESLRNELGYN